MKSILMSIQPKWVEKIISGEKTIEVRKTAPKEVPFKVYMYETKGKIKSRTKFFVPKPYGNNVVENFYAYEGKGKVIGEFICNAVESIPVDSEAFTAISKPSCLTTDELIEYCSGKDMYGLHITDLKVYDRPKKLSDFRKPDTSCGFYIKDLERCDSGYNCERCVYNDLTITRPPQSWQYVISINKLV